MAISAPTLIYCAAGNQRFYEIATKAGFEYGARLPGTTYGPLYFADQDFHNPNRKAYMSALKEKNPTMASVLDLETEDQLTEVLDWAEEAAMYVKQHVMLIPKVFGIIPDLPRRIGGKDVILGYSVPTLYGGTQVPIWEFADWPVHLLGGSPQAQIEIWRYMSCLTDVISIDGNYHNKMAVRHCQFWVPGTATNCSNRYWPTLREADGKLWNDGNGGATYEAFRRSCINIMAAWGKLLGGA